jgi:hypothetical protein
MVRIACFSDKISTALGSLPCFARSNCKFFHGTPKEKIFRPRSIAVNSNSEGGSYAEECRSSNDGSRFVSWCEFNPTQACRTLSSTLATVRLELGLRETGGWFKLATHFL